jgi:hypothetical protein
MKIEHWKHKLGHLFLVAITIPVLGTGCSTSFKYNPKHDQTYATIANGAGLAIRTGQDLRPVDERQPGWVKDAEAIVARALADEVKHAQLFNRVKIHMDSANLNKYSEVVQFRVTKFECRNRAGFLETTGRDLLISKGIRGALIADSIPTKYVSEVEIEFAVVDPSTQNRVFAKTYSATRTVTANGYEGEKSKVRQTSAALEEVVTQFVADLTKIPLSKHSP